jgi:hypothetical protein
MEDLIKRGGMVREVVKKKIGWDVGQCGLINILFQRQVVLQL